jgi:hypothetical protein
MTLDGDGMSVRRALDHCYARLVHIGRTYAALRIYEGWGGAPRSEDVPAWTAAVRRWEEDVAEPFFSAMKQRSDADGLGIRWWIGTDTFMFGEGRDNRVAFAELVRPDGRDYGQRTPSFDGKALATMEADWGDALASARRRNPHTPGLR